MDYSQRMQVDVAETYNAMFDLELDAPDGPSAKSENLDNRRLDVPVERAGFYFAPPRSLEEATMLSACNCNSSAIFNSESLCIAGWQRLIQRPTPTLPITIPQPMELESSCQRIEAIYI